MKKIPIFYWLAYVFSAIISTYPLITNLTRQLPGIAMDSYVYMWNIDTFWFEIFKFHNPFFTNRVLYPFGTSLIFHTYAVSVAIPGIFFLKNLVLYLNLIIILSLVFAGISTYLLVYFFTKNKNVSFISGLTYSMSPVMISYVSSQHYYFLIGASLIPIGFLLLSKFLINPKKIILIEFLISFWLIFFTDYQITIIFIIGCIVLFVANLISAPTSLKKIFTKVNIATTLLLFAIPGAIYVYIIASSGNLPAINGVNNFYPSLCNINLQRVITPSNLNPILGKIFAAKEYDYDTPSYFFGISILLLSIYSSVKNWKIKWIRTFTIFGIIMFLLTLGPNLKIGNTIIESNFMPFTLFTKIPFMNLVDCPKRLIVGSELSISILFGTVSYHITKNTKKAKILFFISMIILLIEYGSFNMPATAVSTPLVYNNIQKERGDKTVLELPSGLSESKGAFGYDWSIQGLQSEQMYWQTIYQKPRIGAYLSRISPQTYQFYKTEPILSDLFTMSSLNGIFPGKVYTTNEVSQFLQKYNLGFIVLSPNGRQQIFANIVEKLFGNFIKQKEEKEGFILYDLY